MTRYEELRSAELLSWVDVARRLAQIAPKGAADSPPDSVRATSVYWSGLTIYVAADFEPRQIREWLRNVFGSWIREANIGMLHIALDSPAGFDAFPIKFEQRLVEDALFRPSASVPMERIFDLKLSDRPSHPRVPLYAFHSVKGGVGRTTSALAFALERSRSLNSPLLFVDADFEAPGASFLLQSRKAHSTISFEDLLALAHADRQADRQATIDFVAQRMADQRVGDIYVLPVKRLLEDLSGFVIRPEDLISADIENPFLVSDLIRKLAEKIGCESIVVDLRAGLVDIAMQFLTDISVERVFVTTAGGQSISSLKSMISTLGSVERQTGSSGRQPFVLFNQMPLIRYSDLSYRGKIADSLLARAEDSFFASNDDNQTSDATLKFGFLPHLTDLIALPDEWGAFMTALDVTNFSKMLTKEMSSWSGVESADNTTPLSRPITRPPEHTEQCRLLQDFAARLEVAETADSNVRPLVTPPMERLASDFINQPPVVIVEGAKGTGKTLAARFFLESETWKKAIKRLSEDLNSTFEGPFLPLFASVASNDIMLRLVKSAREQTRDLLGGGPCKSLSETEQSLKKQLAEGGEKDSWLQFWLTEIASAAGFEGIHAWKEFVEAARATSFKPIVLMEGLEEVLTDPFTNARQAAALVSLLREVPLKFREEAGRPVGYLAFMRADMIEATILQNLAQFRAGYANYALTWKEEDIKELVIWLASNSKAMPNLWHSDWRRSEEESQEADLRRIWGTKLGSDDSREARSSEWVVAVLTDLTGRLTARDLVRFVGEAAKGSRGQPAGDRLLSALALKRAVELTSKKKVEEYPKEVRQLGSIFEKFTKQPGFETPFTRSKAVQIGVSDTELDILEKYGVAYQQDGIFEVPELFRIGLEMKRSGARPNIISLTRRARERAKA